MRAKRFPIAALSIALCAALIGLGAPPPAQAASAGPLFVYTPKPKPGSPPPFIPPPAGQLESPCGLAIDSTGSFYVSDRYHRVIDSFSSGFAYMGQLTGEDPIDGPCGLAVGPGGAFYVNSRHGLVTRFASFSPGTGAVIDPGHATGVAVEPTSGEVYVDDGEYVSVYDSTGAPLEVAGQPVHIGEGSLGSGYGIAVSGFPATEGFLYVPDAVADAVKVYDPAVDTENPVASIDGHEVPGGSFTSLKDAAIAVDDVSGEIYVLDDLQPGSADRPEAVIDVFSHSGAYEGRLNHNIVDARPSGLAVDNSGNLVTHGRVYLTSGNTEKASVIVYPPGAVGLEALPPLESPEALPPGGCACGVLPEPPPPLTCEGDSCQHLPSEPTDLTLTTLVEGTANPPVRFHDTNRLAHYRRLRHHGHRQRPSRGGHG